MNRFSAFLVPAGLVALAGCAPEVKTEAVQAEMVPMELRLPVVGDKKVWKEGEGQFESVVVSFAGVVVSTETSKGCSYTQEAGFAPTQKWTNCTPFDDGTQNSTKNGAIFPLAVGNSVSYAVTGSNVKGNDWSTTRNCSVKGTARVTVPAGTFDTYHVNCSDDWTSRDYYVSPELGTSVLFRRVGNDASRNTVQELISFTPGV
ncbi:MAG: hypothetical protein AAF557_20045 [Pseudomonadota bacterium]